MKYILFFLFCAFGASAYSQTVINDKNVAVRSVPSFSGIKVSGGIDVYLSQGNEQAVAVSASDVEVRNGIKTEVRNGILNIYYEGGRWLRSNGKMRAYVSFAHLQSLEASGASSFIFTGNAKVNTLKLDVSGASEIKGGRLDANDVVITASGASSIKVGGLFTNLRLEASGASDIKNYDLTVDNCVAKISGASDIRMTVSNSLDVNASGASTFYYKGNPEKKDARSSGASSIAQKN